MNSNPLKPKIPITDPLVIAALLSPPTDAREQQHIMRRLLRYPSLRHSTENYWQWGDIADLRLGITFPCEDFASLLQKLLDIDFRRSRRLSPSTFRRLVFNGGRNMGILMWSLVAVGITLLSGGVGLAVSIPFGLSVAGVLFLGLAGIIGIVRAD